MVDGAKLQSRRALYSTLSTQLAHLDDREFRSTLKAPGAARSPWGHSYDALLGDSKVFVKRIPLTELEAAHPWSTRNLFRLPNYYSYGVGSAGFGAWRELVGHITTTNWVLEGATASFPMLFHYRVLPRTTRSNPGRTLTDEYVKRWNSSRAIGAFMRARADAPHDIWLVLEHAPHELSRWIMEHQSRVDDVVRQLCDVVSTMRRNGVVHFDLHFANVVTDGETMYVVDFGLVNDTRFRLTNTERTFLARHSHYDYGESIMCLGLAPVWSFFALDKRERQEVIRGNEWLDPTATQQEVITALIDNADSIDSGPLRIDPLYANALRRYREVILYLADFMTRLSANPRKDTRYDDDHLRRLLENAGAPIE